MNRNPGKDNIVRVLELYSEGHDGISIMGNMGINRHFLRACSAEAKRMYNANNITNAVHRAIQDGDIHVPASRNVPKLSVRQLEVLRLVADGFSECGMAEAMGVEVETVKSHKAALATKLGTALSPHMVRLGHRYCLL